MGSVTTTNGAYALKQLYPQKRIRRAMYEDNPLFALLPKWEKFGGKSWHLGTRYADPQGRSATFATAQANKGNSEGVEWIITRAKDYSLFSIENEAMEASKGDMNALADLFDEELAGAMNAIKRSLAISAYGSGSGKLGKVADVTGSTVTLTVATDISNIEKGMKLVASTADGGGSLADSGNAITVTGVNRSAGTFTFSGSISGLGSTHFLFAQGDYDAKMKGLAAWLPLTAPDSTTFFGVNRAVDTDRLAGVRMDLSGLPLVEGLQKLAHRIAINGGSPRHCIMNHMQVAQLEIALGSRVHYVNVSPKDDATVGFQAVTIAGPKGPISVIGDYNCPLDRVYMLQLDTWKLGSLGPAPKLVVSDGLEIRAEASADAFEGRIAFYGNLGCDAPGNNGVGSLSTDGISLG